jgi:hypothetical protein
LPNPTTRAYEALKFYDITDANLSQDEDLLAFGLIGFSPRQYMTDAELSDISQINLYINKIKKENWPSLTITYGPSGQEILKKIATNPKIFTILDFTEFVDANRKRLPIKKQNLEFGDPEQLAFVMSKQSDWDEIWKLFMTDEYRKSPKYRKNISDNLGMAFLSILK